MKRAFWVLAVAVGGCGGGAPKTYDEYTNAVSQTICSLSSRCQLAVGVGNCSTNLPPVLKSETALYSRLIAGGTVKYDATAAKQCLDAFAATDCAVLQNGGGSPLQSGSCGSVTKGAVAEGGACKYSLECVSGNCIFTGAAHEGCDGGTCGPVDPARGCLTTPCPDGQRCDSTDGGKTYACVDYGDTGAMCFTSAGSCKSNLACVPGPSSGNFGGVCGPIPGDGAPCIDRCSGDLRCSGGKCGAAIAKGGDCTIGTNACAGPNLCVGKPPTCQPLPDGAACSTDVDCGSLVFYYCKKADAAASDGVCTPTSLIGGACVATATPNGCGIGYCDPATSKCKDSLMPGDTCDPAVTQPQQCGQGTTCNATSNKCEESGCM